MLDCRAVLFMFTLPFAVHDAEWGKKNEIKSTNWFCIRAANVSFVFIEFHLYL